MSTKPCVLGVLGGSGFYKLQGLEIVAQRHVHTPFGEPSDRLLEANVGGRRAYFYPAMGAAIRCCLPRCPTAPTSLLCAP